MYMNCAAMNIESSSTSSIQLPSVFRANTFGGSCHTVEGDELVFPNPGASVVYGGKWAGQKPSKDALQLNGCSSDQTSDKFVTLKSNTGASFPGYGNGNDGGEVEPEPTVDEPVETAAPIIEPPVVVVPSSSASSVKASLAPIRGGAAKTQTVTSSSQAGTSSSATVSTSSSAAASVRPSPSSSTKLASSRGGAITKTSSAPVTGETPSGLCTGSGLKCSEDGGSFSVCADGRWVSMGKPSHRSYHASKSSNHITRIVPLRSRRARNDMQERQDWLCKHCSSRVVHSRLTQMLERRQLLLCMQH